MACPHIPTLLDSSPLPGTHRALGRVAESRRVLLLPVPVPSGPPPSSNSGDTQLCSAPPCPAWASKGRQGAGCRGLGQVVDGPEYTPVAFVFQSSTWMKASSSTGSWASEGECGGTASSPLPAGLFLDTCLGGICCSARPSAELSLGGCYNCRLGFSPKIDPQQPAEGARSLVPRGHHSPSSAWVICILAAGPDQWCPLSQIPLLTRPGGQSTLPRSSAGPQGAPQLWLGWLLAGCPMAPESLVRCEACLCELVCASCRVWGQALGPGLQRGARAWTRQLCLRRYNSLSIVPAALGKPVHDVALKVCDGQGWVGLGEVGLPSRADLDLLPSLQAKAVGIQGNLSGDLLQSGGLLVVTKGGLGKGHQRSVPGLMGWEGLAKLGRMP